MTSLGHAPAPSGTVRPVAIERLSSREDYSRFIINKLVEFVHTPFLLLVQWDGYVLDASAWKDSFMEYDLIGAKWAWHKDGKTVGNGGSVYARSSRLRQLPARVFPLWRVCRIYRDGLVNEFGIKFAPEAVADQFSYERSLPNAPTFGFHGLFNMWTHVEDDEMMAVVAEFDPYMFRSREYYELLLQYCLPRSSGRCNVCMRA